VRATDDRFLRAAYDEEPSKTPVLLQYIAYHAIAAIDVSEKDPKSQACDLALNSGRTLRGRVCGPDGKPVAEAFAAGLTDAPSPVHGSAPKPKLTAADFTAVALDSRRPRTLVFWHEQRKLARAVLVRGDEPEPLTIRLEPLGAVIGRLVDADGRPRAGVEVEARYSDRQTRTLPGELGKGIPGFTTPALSLPKATSGPDGRFRIEGLIAGMTYDLHVGRGKNSSECVRKEMAGQPGAPVDLGDIRMTQPAGKKANGQEG
jgi:hypothetical protein